MKFTLRTRLLLATVSSFIVVAALAVLGLPGWVVALVTLLLGGATAAAIVWLLVPFERLRLAAVEAALQAPRLPREEAPKIDQSKEETEQIGQTIWSLLESLNQRHKSFLERELQYSQAITQVQNSLTAIASNGKTPIPQVDIKSPWNLQNKLLGDTVSALAHQSTLTYRRSQIYLAMINELPEAVLVCDEKLELILTNTAAVKLLRTVEKASPKKLSDIFVEKPEHVNHDPDVPSPIGVQQLSEMVQQSQGNQFIAILQDGVHTPISVRMLPASQRSQKGMRVLLARDASQEISKQAETRQRHRRDVGLRMCMLVNKEAGSTLESIRTQASLLTQAAKQVGQREKFLPKINRLLDDLSKQEAIVNLLGWLGRLNQNTATQPDVAEVRLRELVENTLDQHKGTFAERSNTLVINGDAGWIVADEEWISVMLTGLMLHANHSVQQTEIHCNLRRRVGSDTRLRAESSEIHFHYKGQPLSPDLVADIRDPFGRLNSSALAPASSHGFPLGLAVAARVARLMEGDVLVDHEDGLVQLRVLIPTREQASNVMMRRPVVPQQDETEMELTETLGSWGLGGSNTSNESVEVDDVTRTPAPAGVATEDPTVSDETVGGWFGGMRD
jgi:signal transduction histidine kinase